MKWTPCFPSVRGRITQSPISSAEDEEQIPWNGEKPFMRIICGGEGPFATLISKLPYCSVFLTDKIGQK